MASLLTPDTFEFFARYLLAGFVVIAARARFIAGERPNLAEKLIEAVILRVIVQAVYMLLSLAASWFGTVPHLDSRFTLAIEAVVLPAGLGFLAGWTLRLGWQNAMLRRLAMPVEHPIQRAYDFAFDRLRQPCFVILTFRTGSASWAISAQTPSLLRTRTIATYSLSAYMISLKTPSGTRKHRGARASSPWRAFDP